MSRGLFLCALLLCTAALGFAHDSEPINTEFASPLARHTANLNFAAQYLRDGGDYDVAGFDLEYGFASRMQFSTGMPLAHGNSGMGRGNVELALRYMLAGGNDRRFALSINPEVEFPSHAGSFGEDGYHLGAALHLDTHPAERFWTHANLGYSTPVAAFDFKDKTFFYRVAAMYEASERWQPVLELVGEHDYASGEGTLAIEPEFILEASHHWEIKAGLPIGLTRETPDVGAQFKITWKLGHAGRQ